MAGDNERDYGPCFKYTNKFSVLSKKKEKKKKE